MDVFVGLTTALASMQTWAFLIAFAIGCANGMIFGILPGLSGSVGIALMIPFTFGMGPTAAMGLFVAALAGQTFSGSITAILLNTPGTSPNAATTFDGYPLARQGRGGFAIGISATASLLGSMVGFVVLIAIFPAMRSVILAFSFPEFMLLGVMGLAAIALAARGSMLKGLISGVFGLLVSFVGFSPIGGDARYVFGQPSLFGGIDVVPVLIGMFALTEALRLLTTNTRVAKDVSQLKVGRSQVWEGAIYTLRRPFLVVRSAALGTGIGIVPGVGGTVASFLAYFQAAKTVKDPTFGRGDPRGVLAPEAANNAKDAGAALPTLAFGIPGSADWAIILGAMVIHGVQPGPNLMRENPDVVWVAILTLLAAAFVVSAVGVVAAPSLIQVTRVRPSLLAPIVVVLAVVGSFGVGLRMVDVLIAIGFGLLGYAMRAIGMPVIPLILGLILGATVERAYLQTVSALGYSAFFTRPISLILILLTLGIIGYEIYATRKARKHHPREIDEGVRTAIRPGSLALIGALGAIGAVAVIMAADYNPDSRTFPILAGNLLVALVLLYLLIALVPPLRKRFGGVIADGGGMEEMVSADPDDEPVDEVVRNVDGDAERAETPANLSPERARTSTAVQESDAEERSQEQGSRRRLTTSVVLLVALALASAFFGLAVAVPIVLVLFFRLVGRESWRTTSVLTISTLVLLWLMFVTLLGVPVEGGSLLTYRF